jgi:hypothetical protein
MAAKANGSEKKQQKGTTLTDDLFDVLNPNNMMSNAQRVITSAVNVLEEEIAAGILAAKKIEKKVIDVEDIRDDPEDLMNRIRRDTHEAVDLFMDAFTAISKQLGLLTAVTKETGPVKKTAPVFAEKKQESSIPVIENEEPLKAGQNAVMYLSVADDKIKEPVKIQLQKTDLAGPVKQKIDSRCIQLKPSSFLLKPNEEKEIAVHIKLPKECKPGHYSTLITDAVNPFIKMVVGFTVI